MILRRPAWNPVVADAEWVFGCAFAPYLIEDSRESRQIDPPFARRRAGRGIRLELL
jgi:hypothetical protein